MIGVQDIFQIRSIFIATRPFKIGFGVLCYYTLLILFTDALVWALAGELVQIDAASLIRYSLFAYPAWMLFALKGIGHEQIDLQEQGRWFAIDLLPGGATLVFLVHHAGQVFKMPAVKLWLVCYVAAAIWMKANALAILLAIVCLAIGSLNIVACGILLRLWSPRGYGSLLSSLYYSLTWILSGSVFPLSTLGLGKVFELANPFGASISMPLSLVLAPQLQARPSALLSVVAASSIWLITFFLLARISERSRRASLHS